MRTPARLGSLHLRSLLLGPLLLATPALAQPLTDGPPGETEPAPPPPPPGPVEVSRRELMPRDSCIERYTFHRPVRTARWLALGGIESVTERGDAGARASFDIFGHGHFRLGVAASILNPGGGGHGAAGGGRGGVGDPRTAGLGRSHDVSGSAVAYLALSTDVGGFELRAQLGFGAAFGTQVAGSAAPTARTTGTGTPPPSQDERGDSAATPNAEVALLVSHRLGDRWGLIAGPIVTSRPDVGAEHGGDHTKRPVDVTMFAGLGFRL